MPHTGSIEDYFKLSKHTGPKREHDVRQFEARARPKAFEFKMKFMFKTLQLVQVFQILTNNLETDQVSILHVLT